MARTFIDELRAAADITDRGYNFLGYDLQPNTWSYRAMVYESERRSRYFRSLGLQKGDRLALIVPEGRAFVLSFFGAIIGGIVPIPLFPPLALGQLDSYVERTARILRTAQARVLLTSKRVAPLLWSLLSKVPTLEAIIPAEQLEENRDNAFHGAEATVDMAPEDTCFLQFTSGSTADPKGVIVTHGNLLANTKAIMNEGLRIDATKDRGVTWLPLYHDMGLIGFVIAPLLAHGDVVFIPSLTFLKHPQVWMQTVAQYRGTITFAPNFAFGLAAKRQRRGEQLDLTCLRVVGCGAEPINARTLRTFLSVYEPAGLNRRALMPCYGMAEATLAITFSDSTRPFRSIAICRKTYENQRKAVLYTGDHPAGGLELVSCGRTFAGHEIKIIGPQGEERADGEVGEIVFRGPSVTPGYCNNEAATSEIARHGWLHTGDHGFILDGELYVSGREKDLIILKGRNYYPQGIEWEIEQVEGIRPGNAVAFSIPGEDTEQLVVAAEATGGNLDTLAARVKHAVSNALGLQIADVVLVTPGVLPKTSSGKLQRRETKERYLTRTLGHHGNRQMTAKGATLTLTRHLVVSAFAWARHHLQKVLPGH